MSCSVAVCAPRGFPAFPSVPAASRPVSAQAGPRARTAAPGTRDRSVPGVVARALYESVSAAGHCPRAAAAAAESVLCHAK